MFRFVLNMVDRLSSGRSSRTLVNSLRILWIIILLHGELLVFWKAARRCAPWPSEGSSDADPASSDRLLLIGDPQITDAHSYNRPGPLLRVTEFYSDLYMHRNYRQLLRQLSPQSILFMGDLMDGGRELKDEEYLNEAKRFKKLFRSRPPHFYMGGNHDYGFGNGIKQELVDRFQAEFGPTSYTFNTTHYSIVVLDTVSLSSASRTLQSKQKALELLDHLPPSPRILMTHVPLYRAPGTLCGPDRQKTTEITQGRGYQYQNLLTEELSKEILERVRPVAVFSGDDHDYCTVRHKFNNGQNEILEMTVPTFSMAQGLQYPGVVLLDLTPNTSDQSENYFTTKLCWLPDQVTIFIGYGYFLFGTLAVLALTHGLRFFRSRYQRNHFGKRDGPHDLPLPSVMSPRASPLRRCLFAFFHDVYDVAIVGVVTYLVFLILV